MTLQQLSQVKHWHVAHRRDHPVEQQAWDLVLMAWMCGWIGAPAALILGQPVAFAACVLMLCAPSLYVWLRSDLHRTRRLRCDWLGATRSRL